MPKAVLLGAYGLIGRACLSALLRDGFEVTGIGRSQRSARTAAPDLDWRIRDLTQIAATEWREILEDADVVINAAGALQDGPGDDLEAIHVTTLDRLTEAAAGLPLRLIQISAAGVAADASTAFFRTKARGDALIVERLQDWVILRPTLVLAPEAYGGTALLRAAAALPGTLPKLMRDAKVQTLHIDDLAQAVLQSARGEIPSGTIADLTEPEARDFPRLLAQVRSWLGLPPAPFRPALPDSLIFATGRRADLFGRLGWRSPLRTTALRALQDGIRGDPAAWEAAGGLPCRSLEETLQSLPATRQERLFARAYWALPLAIATLSLFWCASGLIALLRPVEASSVLTARGMEAPAAMSIVLGGALADIALGLAILWRWRARQAALGMALLSAGYLAGSLALAPDLWTDPLGPMLKVLPGMALALLVWLMVEDR